MSPRFSGDVRGLLGRVGARGAAAPGVEKALARLEKRMGKLEQHLDKRLAGLGTGVSEAWLEKRLARTEERLDRRLRAVEEGAVRQLGRLDWPGGEVLLTVSSRQELLKRLRPHHKEPWTVAWIEARLRPGEVLYDVGANVGAYSLIAARALDGQARIVAFEPGYANFASLCDNIVVNGFQDAITPLQVVLGEATRLDVLNYSDVGAGAAIHTLDTAEESPSEFEEVPTVYRQPVLTWRLDELVERFDLPLPTHLKLDVDGAEAAVLAGAGTVLRSPGLRSVLVEVDRRQADRVVGLLEDAGLTLAERIDERDGTPMPAIWYGIFERR